MKRPLPVTIIGWLFIAAGFIGFAYHLRELSIRDPFSNDAAWVLVVRLLAIVGGILTLRGINSGRWLIVAWMAYHVVLSYFHSLSELVMHTILLALVAYGIFYPRADAFFNRVKSV